MQPCCIYKYTFCARVCNQLSRSAHLQSLTLTRKPSSGRTSRPRSARRPRVCGFQRLGAGRRRRSRQTACKAETGVENEITRYASAAAFDPLTPFFPSRTRTSDRGKGVPPPTLSRPARSPPGPGPASGLGRRPPLPTYPTCGTPTLPYHPKIPNPVGSTRFPALTTPSRLSTPRTPLAPRSTQVASTVQVQY